MSLLRRTLAAAPAALGFLVVSALPADALKPGARIPAARTLFSWNGTVDREVVLVIRGRSVETRAAGLDASFAPRLDVREGLPRQVGDLDVRLAEGRGEVEVLQRPTARNDYTGMVRVSDPRGGRDNYRLVVMWQPSDDNTWGTTRNEGRNGNDDYGNDRDRNNNGNNGRGNGRGNGGWDDGRNNNGNNGNGNGNGRGNGRNGGSLGNLVTWRGDVDDVIDMHIQGRRIEYRTRSGAPLRNVQFDVAGNGLPRRPVVIEPDIVRGRGDVTVVQQPTARNNYTAVVRVEDRSGGYGRYDFDLRWY